MKEKEIDLFDMIKVLWNKKWFIILNVFWITALSIGLSFLIPEKFKATSVIMPSTSGTDMFSMFGGGLSGASFGSMFSGNTDQFKLLAILKSRTLKNKVVEKFDLVEKYNVDNKEDAIKTLTENMDVGVGEEMQVYLNIWDKDQNLVADITNYSIQCLDSINIHSSKSKGTEIKKFIGTRIDGVMDSLYNIQRSLVDFMKTNNIVSLEDQIAAGVEYLSLFKNQIAFKESQYDIVSTISGAKNNQIKSIQVELNALKKYYNEVLTQADDVFPKFKDIPLLGVRMEEYKRKVQYYTTILQYIGPQYEKSILDEMRDVSTIEILDRAVRPEYKDKPKKSLVVIITFLLTTIIFSSIVIISNVEKFNK